MGSQSSLPVYNQVATIDKMKPTIARNVPDNHTSSLPQVDDITYHHLNGWNGKTAPFVLASAEGFQEQLTLETEKVRYWSKGWTRKFVTHIEGYVGDHYHEAMK
jgi:hypothetical protein